jgi:hypothetical protein
MARDIRERWLRARVNATTTKRQWTGFLLVVLVVFLVFVLGVGIVVVLFAKSCGC